MTPAAKFAIALVITLLLAVLLMSIILPNKYESQEVFLVRVPANGAFRILTSLETYPDWYFIAENREDLSFHFHQDEGENVQRLEWNSEKTSERGSLLLTNYSRSRTGSFSQKIEITAFNHQNEGRLYRDIFNLKVLPNSNLQISWEKISVFSFPFNILVWLGDWEQTQREVHSLSQSKLATYLEEIFPTNIFDGFEIRRIRRTSQHLICSAAWKEEFPGSGFHTEKLNPLAEWVSIKNIPTSGMPIGLSVPAPESDSIIRQMAIPIQDSISFNKYNYLFLPETNALEVVFSGGKDKRLRVHQAVKDYLHAYQLKAVPPTVEQYLYDPKIDSLSTEWRTLLSVTYTEK